MTFKLQLCKFEPFFVLFCFASMFSNTVFVLPVAPVNHTQIRCIYNFHRAFGLWIHFSAIINNIRYLFELTRWTWIKIFKIKNWYPDDIICYVWMVDVYTLSRDFKIAPKWSFSFERPNNTQIRYVTSAIDCIE